MNTWKTEKIESRREYTIAQANRDIGIGANTLRKWITLGWLKCIATGVFTGSALKAAKKTRDNKAWARQRKEKRFMGSISG